MRWRWQKIHGCSFPGEVVRTSKVGNLSRVFYDTTVATPEGAVAITPNSSWDDVCLQSVGEFFLAKFLSEWLDPEASAAVWTPQILRKGASVLPLLPSLAEEVWPTSSKSLSALCLLLHNIICWSVFNTQRQAEFNPRLNSEHQTAGRTSAFNPDVALWAWLTGPARVQFQSCLLLYCSIYECYESIFRSAKRRKWIPTLASPSLSLPSPSPLLYI